MRGERFNQQCERYRQELEQRKARLQDVTKNGADALSDYDKNIAFQGDDYRGVVVTKQLLSHQITYLEGELEDCNPPVEQITLFEAPAPDEHLEAQYEDQQNGYEE